MSKFRQLVADVLALQGTSKAAAAAFAGIQPSALSHWLNGRPSIAHDKLNQVLAYIGLALDSEDCRFRDNEELLSPRIWRTDDSVMDAIRRCMDQVKAQYGEIRVALPVDVRGAAILFSEDGRWGALHRCSPVLLLGHKDTAAVIGPGVIQRILDGDTKALIDSVKILTLAGRVDVEALDVAHSVRDIASPPTFLPSLDTGAGDLGDTLLQWAGVCATATRAGLSPATTQLLIRRFAAMSPGVREQFLKGIPQR